MLERLFAFYAAQHRREQNIPLSAQIDRRKYKKIKIEEKPRKSSIVYNLWAKYVQYKRISLGCLQIFGLVFRNKTLLFGWSF